MGERRRTGRTFPPYGLAGIGVIVLSEALLVERVEIIGIYFTPLVWTGYILFTDALNFYLHGNSLIRTRPIEFLAMLPWSVICWLVFEAYNLVLKNWEYVGLPESLPLRLLGYGWSFATIFPGIFETAELLGVRAGQPAQSRKVPVPLLAASAAVGGACLIIPLIVHQEVAGKLFGLVWLGFLFFLDPLNQLLGRESMLRDWRNGRFSRSGALALSGLLCGILWEFWNYWAIAKWHYAVPLDAGPRMFEMPLLGYLGFIPFAFECFAMLEFLFALLPLPGVVRRA